MSKKESDIKEMEMCECVDFEHGVGGYGDCKKCYGSGWVTHRDICPVCRTYIDNNDKLSYRVIGGKTIHETCMNEEIEAITGTNNTQHVCGCC